ncbi:uncharacterized protein C12orf50 homolog isoform X2 [Ascaphus truei]|uniref:uncharacterized protein C12orf50 homolog isoform X2 n=1 Tax=Ascaphus truei TaxID=8439 RepID=UPI003F591042
MDYQEEGSLYQFHHSKASHSSAALCPKWREEQRSVSQYRHVDMQLQHCTIPCFWENQPVGCVKISCLFYHTKPRTINGLFLPPTSNIMAKADTQERVEPCPKIEDFQKKQNVCRPIHPPLIITINLSEEDDEEEEDNSLENCELRTKTSEEIEEERTIMEMCCKAGDGLTVPTKLDLERERKISVSSNEYIKTNIDSFAKGGGDCYVQQRKLYNKQHRSKSFTGEIQQKVSECQDKEAINRVQKKMNGDIAERKMTVEDTQRPFSKFSNGKAPHGRPKPKGHFYNQRWKHDCTDLEICCYYNTGTPSPPYNNFLNTAPQVKNKLENTSTDVAKSLKENAPKTMSDVEHSKKQHFKRVKKKQWNYEEQNSYTQHVGRKETIQRNTKNRPGYQSVGEGNNQTKTTMKFSQEPTQKGNVRNAYQNPSVSNRSAVHFSHQRTSNVEESSYYSRDQSSSPWSNAPGWRKRMQPTTAPCKMDKRYNTHDNYNPGNYTAPAWRKKVPWPKQDSQVEQKTSEQRRNGSK